MCDTVQYFYIAQNHSIHKEITQMQVFLWKKPKYIWNNLPNQLHLLTLQKPIIYHFWDLSLTPANMSDESREHDLQQQLEESEQKLMQAAEFGKFLLDDNEDLKNRIESIRKQCDKEIEVYIIVVHLKIICTFLNSWESCLYARHTQSLNQKHPQI